MSESSLSRFVAGTVSIGLGNLSTVLLGLLGTMVVTRRLAAEAFGGFVLLQVIATFLAQVSSFGLDASLVRFIAGKDDKVLKRKIINTAFQFRLATIVTVSLLILIARRVLPQVSGSSPLPHFAILAALFFAVESLHRMFAAVLQGHFLFKRIGLASTVSSVVHFLLLLAFVLPLNYGFIGLASAKLISLLVSCLLIYAASPVKWKPEFDPSVLRELLAFGFPLQINSVLTFVFSRIDTVIIGALLGPADTAYYEIARKIPDTLQQLYQAFHSVYFPTLSQLFADGARDKGERLLNHSTRLVSFLTALVALTALFFGRDVIVLAFSERYLPSVTAFVLLMVALNLSLIGNTLGTSLVALGESDKPAIVNIAHMIVTLLGSLLFIPTFGVTGAALASLAGPIVTNPLNVLFLRRRNIDVSVTGYLKPVAVLGAYWLAFHLLGPTTLLGGILAVSTFALPSLLLSIITLDDLSALSKALRLSFAGALGDSAR